MLCSRLKAADPRVKSKSDLSLRDTLMQVLILKSMVLEGRDGLSNDTLSNHRPWDGLRAPVFLLSPTKDVSMIVVPQASTAKPTFGRVLSCSRNIVTLAAVTGKAGICTFVVSDKTVLD